MVHTLRNRRFALLFAGQTISELGNSFTLVAASLLILHRTGSPSQVGLFIIATNVPALLLGLIAGTFVDRWDRRRILIISDMLRGAFIAALPLLAEAWLGWVYIIGFANAFIARFFIPALRSVLPDIVSDEELVPANGVLASSEYISRTIGYALAGLAVQYLSFTWAFYADAATFFLSALSIVPISGPALAAQARGQGVGAVFSELVEGLVYMRRQALMLAIVLIALGFTLSTGAFNGFFAAFNQRTLGGDDASYGLLEAAISVGMALGGLLFGRSSPRNVGNMIIVGLLGVGLATLFTGLSPSPLAALPVLALGGIANTVFILALDLIIQRRAPRELRGRAFAVLGLAGRLGLTIGPAAAGLPDAICGPRSIACDRPYVVVAGVWLILLGVMAAALPVVRLAGQPQPGEAPSHEVVTK
jgi:DHA3 family macrolide efflux protein-like MFS transporter